jgi:uncharacterized protein with PQ loop repeat
MSTIKFDFVFQIFTLILKKKSWGISLKTKHIFFILISLFLISGGLFFYFQERQERYDGLSFIPERSKDVPLYEGLKPNGAPGYIMSGDHWQDIMSFYRTVLPKNGWIEVYIQSSGASTEDGAGFLSAWQKEGQDWELTIDAGYYENTDRTEVTFDKRERITSSKWIANQPDTICINEQPDRGDDCFPISDQHAISQIIELINGAMDWKKEQILYDGKSVLTAGSLNIQVSYDLEKGILLVSDKGTKWMKPEKEFFELTRISKEY